MFHGHLDYFQKPPFGGRSNIKIRRSRHSKTFTTVDLLYVIMCEDPAWIGSHWKSIWSRAWSRNYTWGSVTTRHDFGGVLGRPLDTFFWALAISWSRLLALVWSGPNLLDLTWLGGCLIEKSKQPFLLRNPRKPNSRHSLEWWNHR